MKHYPYKYGVSKGCFPRVLVKVVRACLFKNALRATKVAVTRRVSTPCYRLNGKRDNPSHLRFRD